MPESAELKRTPGLTLVRNVSQFLKRMREGEQNMAVADRQGILQIREMQIGKDGVTVCHSIRPDGPALQSPGSPSGCPPPAGPIEWESSIPRRVFLKDQRDLVHMQNSVAQEQRLTDLIDLAPSMPHERLHL